MPSLARSLFRTLHRSSHACPPVYVTAYVRDTPFQLVGRNNCVMSHRYARCQQVIKLGKRSTSHMQWLRVEVTGRTSCALTGYV